MKQIYLEEDKALGKMRGYTVKKLINSIQFCIGEKLTATYVKDLCDSVDWRVTITGNS